MGESGGGKGGGEGRGGTEDLLGLGIPAVVTKRAGEEGEEKGGEGVKGETGRGVPAGRRGRREHSAEYAQDRVGG